MQKVRAHPTVWYARCAGLDVHKLTVVACLLLTAPSGQVSREVRTFATTSAGLLALAQWLGSQGVTHVAMESTGISWRPVFAILEGRFEVILVNAKPHENGRGDETHRLLLRHLLDLIDFLQAQIDTLSSQIDQKLSAYEEPLAPLMPIPGIGRMAAAAIRASIGTQMNGFPSAKHLASWAGVAPGNKQSGGKRLRASTTKGNTPLRTVLAEVVWVISQTKDTSLSAQSHHLARRIGKKRASGAVSHRVLTIIYHMLRDNQDDHDLGPHFFQTLDSTRQRDSAVRRLQALGYKVTLEEIEEVSA